MKGYILEELRGQYQELVGEREKIQNAEKEYTSLQQLKTQLEQIPKVQEYKSVLERMGKLDKTLNNREEYYDSNYEILERTLEKCSAWGYGINPSETNHIYVYVGSYLFGRTVPYDYTGDHWRLYKNIEAIDAMRISSKEFKKFHEDNTVLFAPEGMDPNEFYKQVRQTFFETAIEKGQEEAIKVIIKRYHFPS